MKLENSIQDNKTIQNLKFNSQIKMVRSGLGGLRGSQARKWGAAFLAEPNHQLPRPLPACPPSIFSLPCHPSVCLHVWPEHHFQADKALVCPEEDNPACRPPSVPSLHFRLSSARAALAPVPSAWRRWPP